MADMLGTGVSALLAFQRALDTTSHNIANASTDGYSRQLTDLATRPPQALGSGWVGTGVGVASVRRVYSQALGDQARTANSSLQALDVYANYADRLDKLFSDANTGLASTLQQFSNAVDTLSTSPNSTPARQVLLTQAQSLVNRLASYQGSLTTFNNQVSSQLTSEATTINSLAQGVADLNKQIVAAQGASSQPPNDLLDKRDQLVAQLGQHIGVTTLTQDDGAMNVFIGSGQQLVVGTKNQTLTATPGDPDRSTQRLLLTSGATPVDVTPFVSGGAVGGLLQLRTELLEPTQNSVGRIATAIATLANQQHTAGLDLNGNFGGNLFSIGAAVSLPSALNTGSGSLAVTRSNVDALTGADYSMRYDGTNWTIVRSDNGATITASGAGTSASPLQFDGLSVVVSGTPQANDSFLVRPTSAAIDGMKVLVDSTDKVAAAAPVLTSATTTNTGSGTIDAGTVITPASWVRGSYKLSFTAANAYQITNAANTVVASGTYTAGANINFNGMRVVVSGAPATGDSFTVADNSNGSGDGRNARALVDLLNSPQLTGATESVADAVSRLTGQIGVQSSQAQSGRDAQSSVFDAATSALQDVSGVNLDEEAANLLRYQQAYQAAARVITAANDMFNALLAATRP
jgi:flagellar hook-associated protein 1 FlgK